MSAEEYLISEIKKHNCICYYPSSGPDLSNIDFLGSGKRRWQERLDKAPIDKSLLSNELDPDLYIHTDVNFYQEFESGKEFPAEEHGIHGDFEILEFKELPTLTDTNQIFSNYEFSGKCFEYKFRAWGFEKIKTLIYCICENEYFVAKILLANNIKVPLIWSKNWNGGYTHGTWLANIASKLQTQKVYTDWLCIPGYRGEPGNEKVKDKYPELMSSSNTKLVRNNDIHWIDEGAHGWIEEFDVTT